MRKSFYLRFSVVAFKSIHYQVIRGLNRSNECIYSLKTMCSREELDIHVSAGIVQPHKSRLKSFNMNCRFNLIDKQDSAAYGCKGSAHDQGPPHSIAKCT